jgi:hypothetical protein
MCRYSASTEPAVDAATSAAIDGHVQALDALLQALALSAAPSPVPISAATHAAATGTVCASAL